jgi:hypothetical protein
MCKIGTFFVNVIGAENTFTDAAPYVHTFIQQTNLHSQERPEENSMD